MNIEASFYVTDAHCTCLLIFKLMSFIESNATVLLLIYLKTVIFFPHIQWENISYPVFWEPIKKILHIPASWRVKNYNIELLWMSQRYIWNGIKNVGESENCWEFKGSWTLHRVQPAGQESPHIISCSTGGGSQGHFSPFFSLEHTQVRGLCFGCLLWRPVIITINQAYYFCYYGIIRVEGEVWFHYI